MKILQILKGDNGEYSSKRFVGVIGALVLFVALCYNVYKPKGSQLSSELIDAVEWVVILSLGFTSVDKFKNERNIKNNEG